MICEVEKENEELKKLVERLRETKESIKKVSSISRFPIKIYKNLREIPKKSKEKALQVPMKLVVSIHW